MSELLNDFSEYAIHKLIVNYMAQDGVLCNADTKDYDEQGTFEGGTGARLSFNLYNKKILDYHTALKTLLGEQRANVRESIPVIDFLHNENTGFLYTYALKSNGSAKVIDTTKIYAASMAGEDPLTLLENEDEFIINRAIMGQPMAEHFYNTTSVAEDYNIQTSPWLGSDNLSYYYRGVLSPKISVNGNSVTAALRRVTIQSTQISDPAFLEYSLNEFPSSDEYPKKGDRYYDLNDTLVIHPDYINELKVDGVNFVTQTSDKFDGHRYLIELGPQDIVMALPRSTYTDDYGLSRILIFKYSTTAASSSKAERKTWDEILALEKGLVGDTYYLIDYPEDEAGTPIPDFLMSDAEIKVVAAFDTSLDDDIINRDGSTTYHTNIASRWDLKTDAYVVFLAVVSTYNSSVFLSDLENDTELPTYLRSKFVYDKINQYVKAEKIYTSRASGLLTGLYSVPLERNNMPITEETVVSSNDQVTKWKFIDETDIAAKRNVTIDVGSKYYKGHLLNRGAVLDEPLKLTNSDPRTVTRDGKTYTYKGKASIIYDVLKNAATRLFDPVKVSNFKNFELRSIDTVVTKADYAAITYTAAEAKDLLNLNSTKTNVSYDSSMRHPDKFKQKDNKAITTEQLLKYFGDLFGAIEGDTLYLDATNTLGPCSYSKITEQPYKEQVSTTQRVTRVETNKCGKVTKQWQEDVPVTVINSGTMRNTVSNGTADDMYNKFDKNFFVTYGVKYKEISSSDYSRVMSGAATIESLQQRDGNIYDVNLKIVSPLELFAREDGSDNSVKSRYEGLAVGTQTVSPGAANKDVALIYPTYTKYFPETLILLSRHDLGLEVFDSKSTGKRGMVSFMKKDESSVISFRVSDIKQWQPSALKHVHVATPDQTVTLNYPEGIYRKEVIITEKYISGFEAKVVAIGTTTVSGYDAYDIASGRYRINDVAHSEQSVYYITKNSSTQSANSISILSLEKARKNISILGSEISSNTFSAPVLTSSRVSLNTNLENIDDAIVGANGSFKKGSRRLTSKTAVRNSDELLSAARRIAEKKNEYIPATGAYKSATLDLFTIRKSSKYDYRKTSYHSTPINGVVHMGSSSSSSSAADISAANASQSGIVPNWEAYDSSARDDSGHAVTERRHVSDTWIIPVISTRQRVTYEKDESYDCFVYVLKPMQLVLNTIELYDQEDRKVDFSKFLDATNIIPMSYPKSYFKIRTDSSADGTITHYLEDRKQVLSLEDSIIIPGLPEFETREDLEKVRFGTNNTISLKPIVNLIYGDSYTKSSIGTMISNATFEIIKNWKFSNSTTNPILADDMISVINGIIELKPLLYRLSKAEFSVPINGESILIRPEYLSGLINHIDNKRVHTPATYNSYVDDSNWGVIGSDMSHYVNVAATELIITDTLPEVGEAGKYYISVDGTQCWQWELDTFVSRTVEPYDETVVPGVAGTVYIDTTGGSFSVHLWKEQTNTYLAELKKRLSSNSLIAEINTATEEARESLNNLKNVLTSVFGPEGELTAETAENLDKAFGTGTKAFLTTGDSMEFDGAMYNVSEGQNTAGADFERLIKEIILQTSMEERQRYLSNIGENLLDQLKNIYKKYYTTSSVETCITSLNYDVFNDSTDLILNNAESSDVINILKEIKASSSFDSFDFSSFAWHNLSYAKWVEKYKLDLNPDEYNALPAANKLNQADESARFTILSLARGRAQKLTREDAETLCNAAALKYELCPEGSTYVEGVTYYSNTYGTKVDTSSYVPGQTSVAGLYTLSTKDYALPTKEQVLDYLAAKNGEALDLNMYYKITEIDEEGYIHYALTIILPQYDASTNTFSPSAIVQKDEEGELIDVDPSCFVRRRLKLKNAETPDVSTTALFAIADFAKTALEGTGASNYYVKYIAGDKTPSGRTNSLYYRRYQMLNNRMNTIQGTLAALMSILKNNDAIEASRSYNRGVVDSYSRFLEVVPISKMEELSWMPSQEATMTTVQMPGKFYYAQELLALRNAIAGQCILTCSACPIKESCPFYSEEEIVKLYCTPATTLDLYFKDNELDLLAYDSTKTKNDKNETVEEPFLNVKWTSSDGRSEEYLDAKKLMNTHTYYNDILKKMGSDGETLLQDYEHREDTIYPISRDLQIVRGEINKYSKTNKFNNTTNGASMGYLLGGRYGTVEKNNMATMANEARQRGEFKEFNGREIPEYQYLYNALYIRDEESYFNYGVSPYNYKVSVEKGEPGKKKAYTGTVKLRVPTSLKAFATASPDDDVYLVSDDLVDSTGNRIVPVIYLNQLKNLEWTFGMDLDPNHSCNSEDDKTIYASDVAQWCVNYYKGNCAEDPVGDIGPDKSAPTKDFEADRDQYWMPEIKKRIPTLNDGLGGYITLEGRPREFTGYQEPVVNADTFDEVMAVAGRPSIISAMNFIRRFSIRLFDPSVATYDENGDYIDNAAWKIKWVKGVGADGTKELSDGTIISWDTQKAVLPLMKTNLRLAIVRKFEN